MTKPDSQISTQRAPFLVYLQLVAVLNHQLNRNQANYTVKPDLVGACVAEAARWGMNSSDCRQVRRYLLEPANGMNLVFSVSDKELRDSLQKLYEMLCEAIGPVNTDNLLNKALAKVSRSKAAAIFSPRRLL